MQLYNASSSIQYIQESQEHKLHSGLKLKNASLFKLGMADHETSPTQASNTSPLKDNRHLAGSMIIPFDSHQKHMNPDVSLMALGKQGL